MATATTAAAATNNTAAAVTNNTAAASYDLRLLLVMLLFHDDLQRTFDEASEPAHPQHLGVIE